MIKSQFGFRSRNHDIYTEKINKIALSFNDNKRIQDNNGINTYPQVILTTIMKMQILKVNQIFLEKKLKHLEITQKY